MKLFDATLGIERRPGAVLSTFRGERVRLVSFDAKRVYVQPIDTLAGRDSGAVRELYPAVVDCEIRDE